MGGETLAAHASEAGIDGLLVVDMPPENAAPLRDPARAQGLDWVALCAPTTTRRRIGRVVGSSTGFVYAVSLKGVTGAVVSGDREELEGQVCRIRRETSLPVAVGFGVRTPEDAHRIAAFADGVVVGSALVRAARENARTLVETVRALRQALVR